MSMKNRFNLAHSNLIIDIDVKDYYDEFRLLKACYQFNWIPRKVVATRRGYHIHFPTLKHSIVLRTLLGDDPDRVNIDLDKMVSGCSLHANVCFKSTEQYEVKI